MHYCGALKKREKHARACRKGSRGLFPQAGSVPKAIQTARALLEQLAPTMAAGSAFEKPTCSESMCMI